MNNPLRFAVNLILILILALVYLLGRETGAAEWVMHQSRCLLTHDQDCVDEHFGRVLPSQADEHLSGNYAITNSLTGSTSSIVYVCKYNPKDGLETFYSAIPCTENNALPSVRRH